MNPGEMDKKYAQRSMEQLSLWDNPTADSTSDVEYNTPSTTADGPIQTFSQVEEKISRALPQATEPEELLQMAGVFAGGETRTADFIKYMGIGTTGLNRWGNNVSEEFIPQLRWPYAAGVYKEMADNDPIVGAVMFLIRTLLGKVTWDVAAPNNSPVATQHAQFVKECMNDMSGSWGNLLSEIMSVFTYGWAYHEVIYKIRRGPLESNPMYRSKYTDGRIGWRKMPPRSQHTLYGWVFDNDGSILAMMQQGPPEFVRHTIPIQKSLLFRTEVSRNNPESKSLLRNAYRPWYFKKRIEEIEGIGIERDLAGLPVLQPPESIDIWGESALAKRTRFMAESVVRNVRRDKSEGIVIPYGWEFSLMCTGGSRQFDTNAIINRYDQRIACTLLADILLIGSNGTGSFALAEVKKSLLAGGLEYQMQNIRDTFNQYAIPRLMQLNGWMDVENYPTFTTSEVEVPSLKELGDFFRATGMTLNDDMPLTNFLRAVASMPQLTEEEFQDLEEARQRRLVEQAAMSASKTGPDKDPTRPSFNSQDKADGQTKNTNNNLRPDERQSANSRANGYNSRGNA